MRRGISNDNRPMRERAIGEEISCLRCMYMRPKSQCRFITFRLIYAEFKIVLARMECLPVVVYDMYEN